MTQRQGSAFFVASLATLLCLGCLESAPPAQPPPQSQWLRQAALPCATTDPAAKDDDLQALGPLVGEASVVGLGEATHGSAEFSRMKHRLLRYLVERQGFTAFGLEADQGQCRALDRHVLTGAGDARALVAGLGMWPWATEEMLDLVAWMRAHNAAHADKVRFFGFDLQDGAAARGQLLDYLGNVDPPARDRLERLLMPLAPFVGIDNPARAIYALTSWEFQVECRSAILRAHRWLTANRARYEDAAGQEAYAWALQMTVLLDQYESLLRAGAFPRTFMAENLRDRYMADNADWAVRHLGARTVLWAHNGHINRKGPAAPLWMNTGAWLGKELGPRYLAVGFAFGAGEFNAVPEGGGAPRPFQVPPPGRDSYEQAFLDAGLDLAFLDLRHLDLTQPGARWFSEPHPFREVGSEFEPPQRTIVLDLTQKFDVLIFMKNVRASKLLD